MNKQILIGRLGKDPELRHTGNGKPVCNFSVATSERWTGADGQKHEETEWHQVVAWEKLAENCAQFLAKGRQVYVEGPSKTRKWQDSEGRERETKEIRAVIVEFLGSKSDSVPAQQAQGQWPAQQQAQAQARPTAQQQPQAQQRPLYGSSTTREADIVPDYAPPMDDTIPF